MKVEDIKNLFEQFEAIACEYEGVECWNVASSPKRKRYCQIRSNPNPSNDMITQHHTSPRGCTDKMKRNNRYNSLLPAQGGQMGLFSLRSGVGKVLLTLCLMMASMGAWAQQYVFITNETNGYFLKLTGNTTVGANQTYDPATCVWTASNTLSSTTTSYTFRINNGQNRYLYGTNNNNNGNLVASTATTYANFRYNNNRYILFRSGNGNNRSVYRNGTNVAYVNNNNTTANAFRYYTVSGPSTEAFTVADITGINNTVTATGTYNLTSAASYTPAYYTFTGADTCYYAEGYTTGAVTTRPAAKTTGFTSETWTLNKTIPGLSISNTGVLTYNTYVTEDTQVTITHTVRENGQTKTATRTVTLKGTIVTSLAFASTNLNMTSTTLSLPAVNLTASNGSTPPGNVTYSSSNTSCVNVSNTGVLTINGAGTATITANYAANGDYLASSATMTITVANTAALDETVLEDMTISPSNQTLDLGQQVTYTASETVNSTHRTRPAYSTITTSGNNYYKVGANYQAAAPNTNEDSTPVRFTSFNWSAAEGGAYFTLDPYYSATSNLVTLTRSGQKTASNQTFTISVTGVYGGQNKTASATVTIPKTQVNPTALHPEPANFTLGVGANATIAYTAEPNYDAAGETYLNITFTSNNTSVATVSPEGVITAIAEGNATITLQAIGLDGNPISGVTATVTVTVMQGTGDDPNNPYYVADVSGLAYMAAHPSYHYVIASDFSASGNTSIDNFSGTLDGGYYTISGLTSPLFTRLNGATVKNVIVDNVDINRDGNVGAIACLATGSTRIYNCGVLATNTDFSDVFDKTFTSSSQIRGTAAVGSIVGEIQNSTRVANCYSYADVNGGTYAAGIVGRYNGTWVSSADNTINGTNMFVMNNMFYGNVVSGTNRSPIVYGNAITGNYSTWSYFRYKSITNTNFTQQNGAMAAQEDMWLKRFKFYQSAVTNHRDMAAVYIFNDASRINEIAQWYIDESIAPWPILRKAGPQKSILERTIPNTGRANEGNLITNGKILVDETTGETIDNDVTKRYNMNVGSDGYLTVNFSINGSSYSERLPITDMDYEHYDYTWGKVVLPFANEFDGWTRDYDYICTGWEISSVSGGTTGTLTDYNFADRNCTAKDIYHATNNPIIFAQGGNWIVPYGVTSINVKAHFAKAFYLADANYDCQGNGSNGFGGTRPNTYHGRTVYTSVANAWAAMGDRTLPHDQALVLVGNYHYNSNQSGNYTGKGCTIMSIDEDNDQQPDFGWYNSNGNYRANWMPMRWDFIALYGFNMVQTNTAPPGIAIPNGRGWLEFTETTICRTYEFESNDGNRSGNDDGHSRNAWIINGGYYQQMVRVYNAGDANKLSYMKVGGNAYIKEFFHGNHSGTTNKFTLRPIIVTGGEIVQCFLTGMGNKSEITATNNNVRFYCAGGKIDKYLSVYNGYPVVDATMKVDHARIGRFFGGGTSPKAQLSGNINITMDHSYVDFFCGGPEFGDMGNGKTVTVSTTGSIFGEYYGAGFGGTALTRITNGDGQKTPFAGTNNGGTRLNYNANAGGFEVSYEMEALLDGGGNSLWRYYDYRADLSMASTGNVRTTAEDCLFLSNFYGGGCQGKVNGTINSTLTNCDVVGSAFGGGYKAAATTINVYPAGGNTWQVWDGIYKAYSDPIYPTPEEFVWKHGNSNTADDNANILYTTADMTQMGRVTNAINITIDGGTVGQNVYGGGNESPSDDATTVIITGGASVAHDVYGGANQADVGGNTLVDVLSATVDNVFGANNVSGTKRGTVTVNINQQYNQNVLVTENVYGGGNLAPYTGDPVVNMTSGTVGNAIYGGGYGATAVVTGNPVVNMTGGTSKLVFGGGSEANTTGNTTVNISGGTVSDAVYGGGALANVSGSTRVDLFGGTVGDAFGGGLGRQAVAADPEHGIAAVEGIAAEVGGNTTVTLGNPTDLTQTSIVTGSIFGANNLNGTPLGHALVRVLRTKSKGGDGEQYHVPAVYGGGNQSAYEPTDANGFAEVIVENCDNSIEYVYGGGNAAPVPATRVTIWGADAIGNVFGGGNGKTEPGQPENPGANVGVKADNSTAYGAGTTTVNIYGGTIHSVFGGSNTKGLIRVSADVNLDEQAQPDKAQCPLNIGEVYGAGNEAEMYGAGNLNLGCITGLEVIYGGAKNADFHGDVELNITSGTFGKVFGGNNLGGTLDGSITVNIDETGCHPVIIGELYACGNLADYTTPLGKSEPTINIISCTRIGSVFGAGLGDTTGAEEKATVTGNPIVNINQIPGLHANMIDADGNGEADKDATRLGEIGVVYGGGNAAKVVGNTTVNVGTLAQNAHLAVDTTPTDAGANITGNVYGGGNQADVTGKTNVTIGQ